MHRPCREHSSSLTAMDLPHQVLNLNMHPCGEGHRCEGLWGKLSFPKQKHDFGFEAVCLAFKCLGGRGNREIPTGHGLGVQGLRNPLRFPHRRLEFWDIDGEISRGCYSFGALTSITGA